LQKLHDGEYAGFRIKEWWNANDEKGRVPSPLQRARADITLASYLNRMAYGFTINPDYYNV